MKLKSLFRALAVTSLLASYSPYVYAETYLTVDQAKVALWQQADMQYAPVKLTKAQRKSIAKASGTRVNSDELKAWKVNNGGWFIIDQVVGKHEMIDIAIALTADGKVQGLEVLQYRETYGDEIRHPKWLAQFIGRGTEEILKLDKQIKNISGATLSCRHVTDGVNRWVHTWDQILRHL